MAMENGFQMAFMQSDYLFIFKGFFSFKLDFLPLESVHGSKKQWKEYA